MTHYDLYGYTRYIQTCMLFGETPEQPKPNRIYKSWGWTQGSIASHYGVLLDKDQPAVGVIHNNTAEWYIEDCMYHSIDLTCENCKDDNDLDPSMDERCMMCESGDHTLLVGSWKQDENGQYIPDENDPNDHGYAAISREIYAQVVWSKYTKRCALCSPCYPGQGDLDSEGEFLTYDLPPAVYGQE